MIVYGLRAVGATDIRYVGQTKGRLKRRLYSHIYDALSGRSSKPVHQWIRELQGQIEGVVLLTNAVKNVDEALMIEKLRLAGADLLNTTYVQVVRSDPTVIIQSLAQRRITSERRSSIDIRVIADIRGRYLRGESFADIAKVHGVPYKTAYNAVHGRRV